MQDPKPPELNRKNLIDVSNLLKGTEHFVVKGTLLGLVRDGNIISYDDDVDFYVRKDYRAVVIERLKATDFVIEEGVFPNHTNYFLQAYRMIGGVKTYVDFYLYQSNWVDDFIIERWNYHGRPDDESMHLHIPKSLIYPLKTARFFDCDIAMPAQEEAICAFLYGADWRTPLRKNKEYNVKINFNTPYLYVLNEMPKRIYSLWMQGAEQAPELVKRNWQRWQQLNPKYELIILDKESSLAYLTDFPFDPSTLSVQTYSDIVRLTMLAHYGGIWTDATVFPVKPLSRWLPRVIKKQNFFAYNRELRNPKPISSWFLMATPDSLIMKKWYDLMRAYWFMPRSLDTTRDVYYVPENPSTDMRLDDFSPTPHHPYSWVHHLFAHLLKTDEAFAYDWDKAAKRTTLKPHKVQQFFIRETDEATSFKQLRYRHGFISDNKQAKIKSYLAEAHMQKLTLDNEYPMRLLERLADEKN
ncbi:MAG: capsular polysaccharide synthesis protein [Candidatus Halichondribacter symbioticus]